MAHGVAVLVEVEFKAPKLHGADGGRRHFVIEEPSASGDEFEGTEDERLARHEVVGHDLRSDIGSISGRWYGDPAVPSVGGEHCRKCQKGVYTRSNPGSGPHGKVTPYVLLCFVLMVRHLVRAGYKDDDESME